MIWCSYDNLKYEYFLYYNSNFVILVVQEVSLLMANWNVLKHFIPFLTMVEKPTMQKLDLFITFSNKSSLCTVGFLP